MANLNTALTADNLTHIRAGGFRFKAYLSVVPETTVATARINQASFSATQAELTVDTTSGWSDVEAGMTVKIGTSAGAGDVYVGRVRKTPGATTLYISEFSNGDPGLNTTTTTTALADNQYVTITSSYNLFSVFPRLYYDGVNYTLYKDYNLSYSGQTGSAKPAIVNIGDHVAGFINTTTSVLTDSRTANVSVFGAETVSSYAWDIADGTLTSGTLADQSITATYPAGNRWISCTVTLSNSRTVTVRRFIAAHDTGSNAPLEIIPSTTRKSRQNSSVTMELVFSFTSGLKNNSMAIFWLDASWGGQTVASASTQFVGWVQDLQESIQDVSTLSFTLVNALSILSKTKAFAQRLEYNASPTDWIYSDVTHVDFAAFYILRFHTTLLDLFDFTGTGLTSYTAEAWRVEEGNFIGQVNRILECVNAEITQVSSGAIYLRRNPAMMGTTARASVVDRMTITADDVAAEGGIDYTFNVRNSVGKVQGNAFSTGTSTPTPYRADGYGTVSGQGTATVTLNDQRVANQTELNERVSNKLVLENNPYPSIRLTFLTGGYDVIEPALWYFTTLSIASSYTPDGTALTFRCIPQDVSISYGENGVQTVTITLSAETNGLATPGETVAIPVSPISYDDFGLPILDFDSSLGWGLGLPSYLGMSPLPPAPVDDADNGVNIGNWALAWNAVLVKTSQINLGSPDWSTFTGIAGNVLSVIRLSSTRAIVLTTSNVYDISTITGTPTVTNRQAITTGKLLRYAEGVVGGIASGMYLLATSGGSPGTYTNNFTSSIGTAALTDGTYPFGYWANGAGAWSATGGRTDAGCMITTATGVSDRDEVTVYVDLGSEATVTAAQMWIRATAGSKNWGSYIKAWDGSKNLVSTMLSINNNVSNTSYVSRSWTGSTSGVRYISFTVFCYTSQMDVYMDNLSISYTTAAGSSVSVKYSDDAWVAVDSTQTVGDAATGETGYDVDDFDLGIHLAAADGAIFSTTSYTGTFAQVTGLSVPSGSAKMRGIRAILKVVASQADNNTASAFQFIYATDSAISGKTLFLVTVDRDTRVAATETDITPIISSTTYALVTGDGNQLETYGGNTRRMIGAFQPVGGGSVVILGTVDGGTTWAIKNTTFTPQWVRFVEPGLGGNGLRIYAAGSDGVYYSTDFGNSWTFKLGDFSTETGSGAATGVLRLG